MDKNKLLALLICVGVVASLVAIVGRIHMESRNRVVETAVDYSDASALALADRTPLPATLAALKTAGIYSVAIPEDTIDMMHAEGLLEIGASSPTETQLLFTPQSEIQMERVSSSILAKTAFTCKKDKLTLTVGAPYFQLSTIGAGLDPVVVKSAIDAGLHICPRLMNFSGANAASIAWTLDRAKKQCARVVKGKTVSYATTVIFNGADVLGNRDHIDDATRALAATRLHYGSIEFGKQNGDIELSKSAEDYMVRVHSVASNEIPTMTEPTALGRFLLGARERNIRLLYIRLFLNGLAPEPIAKNLPDSLKNLPDPLLANVIFIRQIKEGIQGSGLKIGAAHSYKGEPLPAKNWLKKLLLALMAVGVAAGSIYLLRVLTGIDGKWFWIIFALLTIFFVLCVLKSKTTILLQLVAFAAAVVGPSLGMLKLRLPKKGDAPLSTGGAAAQALASFFVATLWTVLGIVFVAGLLSNRLFMLHIEQFEGIRIAIVAPALLTIIYYGLGLSELPADASWSERKLAIIRRYDEFVYSPILIGQSLASLVILAIVGVVVLRSGNDSGMGVSDAELQFRSVLGKLLFVRPRTKEFLFGHPLMVLGLCSAFSGSRKWLILYLIAGAIGEASLLNTFCHIHTPLAFSAIRALLGWVLGAVIGIAAFVLLHRQIAKTDSGQ